MTRANELPTSLLPSEMLERLAQWLECITVVNFDLDVGPGGLFRTWNLELYPEADEVPFPRVRQLLSSSPVLASRTKLDCFRRHSSHNTE